MKEKKEKKPKTYTQKLKSLMTQLFFLGLLTGIILGITWSKIKHVNLIKYGLLEFFIVIFVMHFWILVDRFRLNKIQVDKEIGLKIKKTFAWSSILYRYIILSSLFILFILTMIDSSNLDSSYDKIIFTIAILFTTISIYLFIRFEIYFKKTYHFKIPQNLFIFE